MYTCIHMYIYTHIHIIHIYIYIYVYIYTYTYTSTHFPGLEADPPAVARALRDVPRHERLRARLSYS